MLTKSLLKSLQWWTLAVLLFLTACGTAPGPMLSSTMISALASLSRSVSFPISPDGLAENLSRFTEPMLPTEPYTRTKIGGRALRAAAAQGKSSGSLRRSATPNKAILKIPPHTTFESSRSKERIDRVGTWINHFTDKAHS